jgi:hypothetical protein
MALIKLQTTNTPHIVLKLGEDFDRDQLLERFPTAKTFPQIELLLEDGERTIIGGYEDLIKHLG